MAEANETGLLDRLARRFGPNVIAPVFAGVVAILVSSLALLAGGYNPFKAFAEIGKVLWSVDSLVLILNRGAWYYVAGVAVAIGFKMGLFNIGADGQYRLGALFAAYFGAKADLPPVIHVTYIILIAVFVGAMWAAIPGILKVTRGVNEVISTIMLNFIATGISAWLLGNYFRREDGTLLTATKVIPISGRLPSLNRIFSAIGLGLPKGSVLQGYIVIAILVGIGYYVLLFRSRFGFELRVTGQNPAAAKASGVKPKRMILTTIILSGAIAGLIGIGPLLSDSQHLRYSDQFPFTLGFTGLSLALLGRNHPVGIAFAAIVWHAIERGTQPLTSKGYPQEIGRILQGAFLLTAVIVFEVMQRRAQREAVRDAATRAAPRLEGAAP
jgi:simple sugar transport system permease protein